jgi:nitric oxide reductase subunit C
MKFRLKVFLATVFLSLVLFSLFIYNSTTGDEFQEIPSEAVKGKMVFQKKACVECHTLFGNGGYYGGDLTKTYEKFGSEGLRDYLTHPPLITGSKKKQHIYLSNEEADEMIAYFRFVQSIHNMDWPPRPIYDKKAESK